MALDAYGLTRRRDTATLERFLDEFVDRVASADRGDEELMIEPLGVRIDGEEWEYEPSLTLSHILERGLAHPRRAIVAYLTPLPNYCQEGVERVILGFTRDDQLVLGLSIYSGQFDANEKQARKFLARLAEEYHCYLGLILIRDAATPKRARVPEGLRHPAGRLPR